MFYYILGKAAVDKFFFIQDLHLNFHSFLGLEMEIRSVKEIMSLSANITISDWLEMFLISNSIVVMAKVNHMWIIFP